MKMVNIALCETSDGSIVRASRLIDEYIHFTRFQTKLTIFNSSESLLNQNEIFDVYILLIDPPICDTIPAGIKIRQKAPKSFIIFVCETEQYAFQAYEAFPITYLIKPVEVKKIHKAFDMIKYYMCDTNVVVQTPDGHRRLKTKNINYVNIEGRCLSYHLDDDTKCKSCTIRGSFAESVHPLDTNDSFIFLEPSLLINLRNIKVLGKDNIVFESEEKMYFPKTKHDRIEAKWKEYLRV